MVKKRVRDPEVLPEAPAENDSDSDNVSLPKVLRFKRKLHLEFQTSQNLYEMFLFDNKDVMSWLWAAGKHNWNKSRIRIFRSRPYNRLPRHKISPPPNPRCRLHPPRPLLPNRSNHIPRRLRRQHSQSRRNRDRRMGFHNRHKSTSSPRQARRRWTH